MTRWNTSAVVLFSEVWGESDLLVRFMTPGQGRVVALAKGALRSRKRFSGMFDQAQLVELGFMTGPRTGRVMVEHASVKDQLPEFRQHPLRLARAALLLEIVSMTVPEHEPSPHVFDSLKQGLTSLHQDPDQDRWAVAYAYRLLAGSGYRPGLSRCVSCLCPQTGGELTFSPGSGGVLCPACSRKEPESAKSSCATISLDTARTLNAIMDADKKRLLRTLFTRNALIQAQQILAAFIAYHLGRPSRALEFMEKFKSLSAQTEDMKT